MNNLPQIFNLYLQGYSLRNLSKRFHIPKSTLSYQFRKKYGDNYTQARNSNGIIPVIKEYLHSPDIDPRYKNTIRRWLNDNLAQIMESEAANLANPIYSDRHLDKLTYAECGHKSKDWKQVFEVLFSA